MTHRIVLADDHQMFREALRLLLERQPGFAVVGETGDGREVISLVRDTAPDLVCLDIDMPGLNGVAVTRQLSAVCPTARVIALSSYCDRHYVRDMLAAGARGYVTKSGAGAELLRAIDAVGRDRAYLCPEATDAVRAAMSSPDSLPHSTHHSPPGSPAEPRLGPREVQVLQLVALGLTSARIAERLDIAPSTVEVHRRNIMRKLGVDGAVGMTRYAIRHGLAPDG